MIITMNAKIELEFSDDEIEAFVNEDVCMMSMLTNNMKSAKMEMVTDEGENITDGYADITDELKEAFKKMLGGE